MPRNFTSDELGFTQEQYDYVPSTSTPSKADNLSKRRDEKLYSLSSKTGMSPGDLGPVADVGDNTLYMENKILNDYTPSELNAFQSMRYAEAGVYPEVDEAGYPTGSYTQKDAEGAMVPYQGSMDDVRSLYLFNTKGSADDKKLGISWDPEAFGRYKSKTGDANVDAYGKPIGPVGVDRTDRRMALAYKGEEADLFEGLRHGNTYALDSRKYANKVGSQDDKAYWDGKEEFGTGFNEAYTGGPTGVFGSDFEHPLPGDIAARYVEFKNKYGLTDKKSTPVDDTSDAFRKVMLKRESSNDYTATNDGGYVGGYQMGAQALETLGYVKPGTYSKEKGNSGLDDTENWTGKGGASSKETFLASAEVQDTAFEENKQFNLNQLQRNGVIGANTSEEDKLGYLAAAHLLGAGNATNLDTTDANDTTGREYFNLGKSVAGSVSGEKTAAQYQADIDATRAEKRQAEARDMGTVGKLGNAVDVFQASLAKEAGADFADWVGEGLKKVTGYGWDVGTEEEKQAMVNETFGVNEFVDADKKKEATDLGKKILSDFQSADKEIDVSDIGELVYIGASTPSMAAESFAFVASMFIPLLGWGGKVAKADKLIDKVGELRKSGEITDEVAELTIKEAKDDVTTINNVTGFLQKNAGLLQVSAGNVNDEIDSYTKENGAPPSVGKIAQMYTTETLLLGMEKWVDISIIKSPAMMKEVKSAFGSVPVNSKVKLVGKAITVAAGLTANMGKEAGQEYLQSLGQALNVKWNFDDNGTVTGALDEAGNVLYSDDTQAEAITSAGLGAGGAVQFAGLGVAGKAVGVGGSKAGELAKKASPAAEVNTASVDTAKAALSTRSEKPLNPRAQKAYADISGDEVAKSEAIAALRGKIASPTGLLGSDRESI
ncbi:MAG: hypothetical protein PF440_03545, partial [Thiomicrorhabdus sp.]|nr:hypothetical protein [Thiomicrorhabdus sp.]